MSARDVVRSDMDAVITDAVAEQHLDTFRAEVIAARDAQIIEWLENKAREEGSSNKDSRTRATAIYRMADKLSRGAVRPPLSKGPGPTRAEVLAEAADKLVLELAPEQPGAGPGFLLALRLAVQAIRRMADDAATGGAA